MVAVLSGSMPARTVTAAATRPGWHRCRSRPHRRRGQATAG
ncbi:hypothetical protein L083_2820 [Actinoplanes sp. N902-109]|nr:hypothetical protein L083_2820 [Actinoplanes sp. N902-109]